MFSFLVWFLSLSISILRYIHVVGVSVASFLHTVLFHCRDKPQFNCSLHPVINLVHSTEGGRGDRL